MSPNTLAARRPPSAFLGRAVAFLTALSPLLALSQDPSARVIERGPHHTIHHWQTQVNWPDGRTTLEPHYLTELATGLNRPDPVRDEWVPSREEIEIFPGGAIARQALHQARFAGNLNSEGAIELVKPDGQILRSHILGLAYLDTVTGQTALIAETKDSAGEVFGNQVIYKDFLDGPVRADARFVFTKAGFEQDIVLHSAPPSAADYGMDPAHARLEIWTEFVQTPEPTIRARALRQEPDRRVREAKLHPDFVDATLGFGGMEIGSGRAFVAHGDERQGDSIRVAKSWIQADGRRFLVEGVEWSDISPLLQGLQQAAVAPKQRTAQLKGLPGRPQRGARVFPAAPSMKPARPLRMASAGVTGHTVVLDYQILNSSLTNYVFRSDSTFLINGPVALYGPSNILEGGSVLKFAQNLGATLDVKGTLTTDTDLYRPVILTAAADASVGEPVGGVLSGYYASPAINFDFVTSGQLAAIQNLRIQYALLGVKFNGGSGHELRHVQWINCGDAVRADNAQYAVRNALGWNLTNALTGSFSTGVWEHATLDGVTNLLASAIGQFTNCLFTAVGSTAGLSGLGNSVQASGAGIFKTVGFGSHYLADGSVLRDAGTPLINPTLALELQRRTTYAPVLLPTLNSNATLAPKADRDIGPQDIGWHYPPLDYYASATVVTNVTVVMTNGTALGLDLAASWGLDLRSAKWISIGSPTNPNFIVRAHLAQEQSGGNPATRACFYDGNSVARACELRLRFTEFSQLQNDGNMISVGTKFTDLEWTHSKIYNPSLIIDTSGTGAFVSGLTNSLWDSGSAQFGVGSASGASVLVHMRNNLVRRALSWQFMKGTASWTLRDNLFDSVGVLTNNGAVVQNWTNAYFNTPWGLTSGVGNISLGSLGFEPGPLGRYYLQSSSTLLNKGTRNATNAMLYAFTCTTNNVRETNSIVDIGLHFAALNSSGQLLDTDGDGLPDVIEDINSDGFVNAGETSWTLADTDGDGVNDLLEILLGRSPTVAGATSDVNKKINLRLFTPLR
jgi:hypothetical protein